MQALPEPDTHDLIGRVLGEQFRLERFLGRGGMGAVYLAEQLEVERRVVIKVLNAPRIADPNYEARFKQEARALAQLNHPNVVHLYAFGRTDDGLAYLAMEYVEGRTLASVITDSGAMAEPEVLGVVDQLCSALREAHARGVIHRDLKPENVMLVEPGEHDRPAQVKLVKRVKRVKLVKVLDFGIAKLTRASEARLTRNGEILGTPLYMAPEQLRGSSADERTDIYALGVIAYELVTGQVPFEAESTLELLARVMDETPLPPHRKAPGIDVSVATESLILRCLMKDPAERFQSAGELQEALLAIRRDALPPSAATPVTSESHEALQLAIYDAGGALVPVSVSRTRVRSRMRVPTLLVLGFAVLAAGWFGLYPQLRVAFGALGLQRGAPADSTTSGPLSLREWVQGIPFPAGTDYVTFEDEFIEARVPASAARVLAFYRQQFATKWGGFRELADGLIFESALAPVERLTVTPADSGSRVAITRRPSATPHKP